MLAGGSYLDLQICYRVRKTEIFKTCYHTYEYFLHLIPLPGRKVDEEELLWNDSSVDEVAGTSQWTRCLYETKQRTVPPAGV